MLDDESRTQDKEVSNAESVQQEPIPVVALGGSAGAFEEFRTFFSSIPIDSGAAFVVVQHLLPLHESILAKLLTQCTRMVVAQAVDGQPVCANCVYVIQPGTRLSIHNGVLHSSGVTEEAHAGATIDFFLCSLAQDLGERAICILFSGAGSDGTHGLQAIRGAGGLSLVQDPNTAQFQTMPRSAMNTGAVDFVLSTSQIPKIVLKYLQAPYVRDLSWADTTGESRLLEDVLAIVLTRTGRDFRGYKKGTIARRIQRRMCLYSIEDEAQYVEKLRHNPSEVDLLFQDFLINVTLFFRDPDAYEELRHTVILPMVHAKETGGVFRIWVAGCASGEEAYSLAILFHEEIAAASKICSLQIFATDLDDDALAFARQGVFPETIANSVSPLRLTKFFFRTSQGFQVTESLRKTVVFANQNLITDPSFSKMDLISCRNLFIYLEPETQTRVLRFLAFALNPGGYLFLGKSETVAEQNADFHTISRKAKIYQILRTASSLEFEPKTMPESRRTLSHFEVTQSPTRTKSFADIIKQVLLSHFNASLVLVNRSGDILQFHGDTDGYLSMPRNEPSLNILNIARHGLSVRLRALMRRAIEDGKLVVQDGISLHRAVDSPILRLTVTPVEPRNETEPLLAIIFEEAEPNTRCKLAIPLDEEGETLVKHLEVELQLTRQELQSTIMELQSTIEELRVANEEVSSSNEELQSTNEELGTSQEELQSVNEELSTVNTELQQKVEKLDSLNSDLNNLLKSTEIAAIFVDTELRIRFFTPETTNVLNIIPSDVGRPIHHVSLKISVCNLAEDAQAVLAGQKLIERDVSHTDGRRYFVHFSPYRSSNDQVEGVVITFSDVTTLQRALDVAQEANRAKTLFLANMSHELRTPLNAVIGFADLLMQEGVSPTDRAKYLDVVLKSGKQLVSLVDDLLDMAKVETGKVTVTTGLVSPITLVGDVIRMLEPRARLRNISVTLESGSPLPDFILSDEKFLRQILTNLIDNAIKFSPENSNVLVSLNHEQAENQLFFSVSDMGPGIPRHEQEIIFEMFHRGTGATAQVIGGTGLGLALSRKLARILGGDVTLATRGFGTGATFVLTVPVVLDTHPSSLQEVTVLSILPTQGLKNLRILVAEDDASSQCFMQTLLAQQGSIVEIVATGNEAVEAAFAREFDAILMDLSLPGQNGLDATRELRAKGYSVPIIAVSAHAMLEQRVESMAAGCNAHITKPVSVSTLVAALNKYCGKPSL